MSGTRTGLQECAKVTAIAAEGMHCQVRQRAFQQRSIGHANKEAYGAISEERTSCRRAGQGSSGAAEYDCCRLGGRPGGPESATAAGACHTAAAEPGGAATSVPNRRNGSAAQ